MEERFNKHLSDDEVDLIKEELKREVARIGNNNLSKQKSYDLLNDERKDSVDEANQDLLMSYSTRQTNRENLYLKKVLKSLEKIEEGEYGVCEDCGSEIPFRRLRARITSSLCIICKEESEHKEMTSIFGRRSKSLGRTIQAS